MDDQNKNMILAMVLSLLVFSVWMILFPVPEPAAPTDPASTSGQVAGQTAPAGDLLVPATEVAPSGTPDTQDMRAADEAGRIEIDTPALSGSISLLGGRFDDLALKGYHVGLSKDSPIVTLLRAQGQADAYYALYGWVPGGQTTAAEVPGQNTIWTLEQGEVLTPDSPVTLKWDNGQ
ncbi:MAG: membrane protein insertase YidC, partial [Rhodobacterales bacterium]